MYQIVAAYDENEQSNFARQGHDANQASMSHKHVYECVDRTLRDQTGMDKPFGGKIAIVSGDFRQILPVVAHAWQLCWHCACNFKEIQTLTSL